MRSKTLHGLPTLSRYEREWAYTKWCDGYDQAQIAEALDCSIMSVRRAINDRPRIKTVLVYDGKDAHVQSWGSDTMLD